MIAILRFLSGYIIFKISGSRPGTLINELLRRGIKVWGIRGNSGEICARVSCSDYPIVQQITRGGSRRVHIIKKRGVPFILHKNRKRKGLIVGAALFLAIFKALSLFVWTVDICEFQTISQTSARDILRRVGIYEGVRGDFESLKRMQTTALIEFGNLSWITINADGSRGEVGATEKQMVETSDNAPRNIKASADGQVVRADAYSGTAVVAQGDAVRKGDLLISGVVESMSGSAHFERADGVVLAQTRYHERIEIPNEITTAVPVQQPQKRYSARLFGVLIPLTITQNNTSDKLKPEKPMLLFRSEDQVRFRGDRASASLLTEKIYDYKTEKRSINSEKAEKLFTERKLLKELFCYNNKEITECSISVLQDGSAYRYEIEYNCIEDIAKGERILLSD